MKIGILLSGGIDSMMAARLLLEQGHEVCGITMITQPHFDLAPAEKAARWLGIRHETVDFTALFREKVMDYFCASYEKGETPNPCVVCNQTVKLGALLDYARAIGCEKAATGHYARIAFLPEKARYALLKGVDSRKDQSYFLYRLPQEALRHLLFPLGGFTKAEVRRQAEEWQFPSFVTQSRESQEICFIPGDYRDFIREKVRAQPGDFVDENGKVLGKHTGIPFYTVGQRKGLGISAPHPLYVLKLYPGSNRILLGKNEQLFRSECIVRDCVWNDPEAIPSTAAVKIRYAAAPIAASIEIPPANPERTPDAVRVKFTSPQRAITPGQSAVFYDGDRVVGGGILSRAK